MLSNLAGIFTHTPACPSWISRVAIRTSTVTRYIFDEILKSTFVTRLCRLMSVWNRMKTVETYAAFYSKRPTCWRYDKSENAANAEAAGANKCPDKK